MRFRMCRYLQGACWALRLPLQITEDAVMKAELEWAHLAARSHPPHANHDGASRPPPAESCSLSATVYT